MVGVVGERHVTVRALPAPHASNFVAGRCRTVAPRPRHPTRSNSSADEAVCCSRHRDAVAHATPQSRANNDAGREPMTDLLQVLPDFDARPYTHLLPSLDKALITTNDLLTLEPADAARRAQLPPGDLRRLVDAVVRALHADLGFGGEEACGNSFLSASGSARAEKGEGGGISTLDEKLDAGLGGGIRPGYLVEVTGERYGTHPI